MDTTPAGLDWTWAYFFDVLNILLILLGLLLLQQVRAGTGLGYPFRRTRSLPPDERELVPVTAWAGGLLLFFFDASVKILVWDTYPGQGLHAWGQTQRAHFPGLPLLPELVAMAVIVYGLLRYLRDEESESKRTGRQTDVAERQGSRDATLFYIVNMGLAAVMLGVMIVSIPINPRLAGTITQPVVLGIWQMAIVAYAIFRVSGSETWIRRSALIMLTLWGLVGIFGTMLGGTELVQVLAVSAFRNLLLLVSFVTIIWLTYRIAFFRIKLVEESRDRLAEEKEIIFSFMSRLAGSLESRKTLAESLDVTSTLSEILDFALETTHASAGAIYLIEDSETRPGEQDLVPKVVQGYFPPLTQHVRMEKVVVKQKMVHDLVLNERIPLGEGLAGRAAVSGQSELVRDAETDMRVRQSSIDFLRIKSMVVVPLKDQSTIAGVLIVVNKHRPEGMVSFDDNDEALLWSVADLAAITINNARMHHDLADKERFERELQIAQDVQTLLLPAEYPSVEGYEIRGYNRPAWRVGGDYYDFIWIDETRLMIVIADVAGKGISGALTMSMVRTLLRAEAPRADGLKDLLLRINRFVYRDTKSDTFVSMMLAILDTRKHTLDLVRAGHEPLIRFGESLDDFSLVAPEGMALGLDSDALFRGLLKERTLDLHEGDVLVFYTDGVTEAMNADHEEFTLERLIDTIKVNRNRDSSSMVEAINKSLSEFTGEIPQHDDLTFVLLKFNSRSVPAGRSKVERLPQRQEDKHVEKVRHLHNSHSAG